MSKKLKEWKGLATALETARTAWERDDSNEQASRLMGDLEFNAGMAFPDVVAALEKAEADVEDLRQALRGIALGLL